MKKFKAMKQIGYLLVLVAFIAAVGTSCKDNNLDALRENEIAKLDKYVKDNNISDKLDASGIYYIEKVKGTGDTIKSGYTVMLFFKITLLDGSEITTYGFSTEDEAGRNYEEVPFYVDVNNDIVNAEYVQQIAGMHHGLKKMQVGGEAEFIIPSELAFKALDYSSVGIPRFSTLKAKVFAKKGYKPGS